MTAHDRVTASAGAVSSGERADGTSEDVEIERE
jgi:hypothetical protein